METISFETTRFGTLEVRKDRIIYFNEGIPGFTYAKRYILIDYKDTEIKWLQSVDDPDLAFIVTEARLLIPEYSVRIDDTIRRSLELKDDNDLVILLILRIEDSKIIPNLYGPLLINASAMKGIQLVQDNLEKIRA